MNKYTDINESHRSELEAELVRLNLVKDKLRYLNDQNQKAVEAKREDIYNTNIKDKVFIWVRDKGHFALVRAKNCTNWGIYNSCNATTLKMYPFKHTDDIFNNIHFLEKDTIRVDMLGKELRLATDEDIENTRQLLYKQVDRFITHFK